MAKPAAFLGMLIFCLASGMATAAQTIPLPTPAPFPKTGEAPRATPPAAVPPPPPAAPPRQSASPLQPFRSLFGQQKPANGQLDADQRALVDRVSQYLTSLRTLVGDFVQIGPNGNKTQGQLYIQKPGRVRFEYASPSPIELVSDGQSLVVRDRKLATQDLYPLSQTPLRVILADRVDLLRDTNVIGAYLDDTFATVVLEEDSLGGKHRLMLMFGAQDFVLRQWTITDSQGFDTTVAVYNLDTNKKPDPSLFKINYEVNRASSGNN